MRVNNERILMEAAEIDRKIGLAREQVWRNCGYREASMQAAKRQLALAKTYLDRADKSDTVDDFLEFVAQAKSEAQLAAGQREDAKMADMEVHKWENEIRTLTGQPWTDYDTGEPVNEKVENPFD